MKSDPGETDAAAHLQRQNNIIKYDQIVLQTACSRKAGPERTSQDGLEQQVDMWDQLRVDGTH